MRRLLNCVLSCLFALAVLASATAHAAELRVLSAGAVEPGIQAYASRMARELGMKVTIQFNTAPQIAQRLAAGESYDVLISPPAVIDQAIAQGKAIAAGRQAVGRVGAGVAVRRDAPLPDIRSVERFRQALLDADSLVYNNASTGLYLDKLFARMGVADALKGKTTRYANGASVLEHVIKGKGREIGFGAITEIHLYTDKGLKYVGPLPPELQNYTSYDAAMMSGAAEPAAAQHFVRRLAAPEARATFARAGIE